MNMKARKKNKKQRKKRTDDMVSFQSFLFVSLSLLFFQFSQVMSYGSRVADEYETSVFSPFP